MRLPILYTMSWPQRVPCSEKTWPRLDFVKMGDLTFRCGFEQRLHHSSARYECALVWHVCSLELAMAGHAHALPNLCTGLVAIHCVSEDELAPISTRIEHKTKTETK